MKISYVGAARSFTLVELLVVVRPTSVRLSIGTKVGVPSMVQEVGGVVPPDA